MDDEGGGEKSSRTPSAPPRYLLSLSLALREQKRNGKEMLSPMQPLDRLHLCTIILHTSEKVQQRERAHRTVGRRKEDKTTRERSRGEELREKRTRLLVK